MHYYERVGACVQLPSAQTIFFQKKRNYKTIKEIIFYTARCAGFTYANKMRQNAFWLYWPYNLYHSFYFQILAP